MSKEFMVIASASKQVKQHIYCKQFAFIFLSLNLYQSGGGRLAITRALLPSLAGL
jgi:hypothetical protein